MTSAPVPPQPVPPPPPPPLPPRTRPAWFNLAIGGGVAVVTAVVLLATGVFSDDSPVAASTTTRVSTTSGGSTTTSAGTSTTLPETTTTAGATVLIRDTFEPGAAPSVSGEPPGLVYLANGRPKITSKVAGLLPVTYDLVVGDADISFAFRPLLVNQGSGVGAILLADDPSDGEISSFVVAYVVPLNNEVLVQSFAEGIYEVAQRAPIPPEAGFVDGEFNTMQLSVRDGGVVVSINGVAVVTWTGTAPATEGYLGWVLAAVGPDDAMVVDNFIVTVP